MEEEGGGGREEEGGGGEGWWQEEREEEEGNGPNGDYPLKDINLNRGMWANRLTCSRIACSCEDQSRLGCSRNAGGENTSTTSPTT